MKGSECRLIEFMDGSKKRFIIPVYQRNYDWKIENCKQLFDDLVKVIKNERSSHFFGSIVSVYEPSGRNTDYLVIDGQQRLTTVSLLLLAMYNLINNQIVIPSDDSLGKQIYEDFLVDKYQPQEQRVKLKPVKNDQCALEKLFEPANEHIKGSNVTNNYNYFYERIQKQEISIDELFDAICRLEIINISLNNEDNPQLIFESLNSTGLDLSEGDKIRNYILMRLPTKEQNEYYEKYWNRIEECTRYDVSSFIRDFLIVKLQSIPSQRKVYISFKEYVEQKSLSAETLLKELLEYAKRYAILLNENIKNVELKSLYSCVNRLNRLETNVTRPFFLEVLRLYDESKLSSSEITEIFLIIENYIFRRSICDLPTNVLNKIFSLLHREITRYDGNETSYVEKLKYALLSKKEKARFPDDNEFSVAFSNKQVYQLNSKNKIYILERLENFNTLEDKDIYAHCDDGTYSIEHIMPQHLTPAWKNALGNDYEQIHSCWLHRIANLTLTAYNSKYSNKTFEEKKNMPNGFADSGIRMNTYIAQKNKWTLSELEERDQLLCCKAIEIWSYPVSEFKPVEKELDSYTLDDDYSLLTGRLLSRFSYKNTEYPVKSWVEMYQMVLKILYEEDPSIISKLASSKDDSTAMQFSLNNNGEYSKSVEIADGIYVLSNRSNQSKLAVLSKVFKLYDAELTDLVFYLSDENKINDDDPERYELRLDYWTYALPIIRKATNDQTYKNVSPSKHNSVNGFFGVSGCNLCCVAGYNSARVELKINKRNKQENIDLFNKLKSKIIDIETALGTKLNWEQDDNLISSKVYIQKDNVSIKNKDDWQRMASFHAEWVKKFCEHVVIYLQ